MLMDLVWLSHQKDTILIVPTKSEELSSKKAEGHLTDSETFMIA
jgi:hypothetical protein